MSSMPVAATAADRRRRFHAQTLRLYTGMLTVASEYPVPVDGQTMASTHKLIELYRQLREQHDVLCDFAAVFEKDPDCVVPICGQSSIHEAAIHEAGTFLIHLKVGDNLSARLLTNSLIKAGVSFGAQRPTHLYELLDDERLHQQIETVLTGELARAVFGMGGLMAERQGISINRVPYAKSIERNLRQEAARALKLFVLESHRTIDTASQEENRNGGSSNTRISVNDRMLATMFKNPESNEWTAEQWRQHLDCAASTVKESVAWATLMKMKEAAKLERIATGKLIPPEPKKEKRGPAS